METISNEYGMHGERGYTVLANTPGNFFVRAHFDTPEGGEFAHGSGTSQEEAFVNAASNLIGMDFHYNGKGRQVEVGKKDGVTEASVSLRCNGIPYTGNAKVQGDDAERAIYLAVCDAVRPIIETYMAGD